MCNITINQEKNGIELRFVSKPSEEMLNILKENGFRWSMKQKMWYAKHTPERMNLVSGLENVSHETYTVKNGDVNNLFQLTRSNDIQSNVDHALRPKDIASHIRSHIKSRFPMCAFSVITSNRSVHIDLKSSPWERDSDVLEAIMEYVQKYADSYRYCTHYDPYGDYGSEYNFYDGRPSYAFDYEVREATVHEVNLLAQFERDLAAFKEEERLAAELRIAKELEERRKAEIEYQQREAIRSANREKVEAGVAIRNLDQPYYLQNCIDSHSGKCDRFSSYAEDIEYFQRCVCHVSREVYLTTELFDLFSNQLMDEWSFIAGTGCSRTNDRRVSAYEDYSRMNEDERKTVVWYSAECVAVFCDEKLMFVVDAQGYEYCRYVYSVDDLTQRTDSVEFEQVLSEEDYQKYYQLADQLYDISTEIIINNNWDDNQAWRLDCFNEYKHEMIRWISEHKFPFNVHVVRAIPGVCGKEFKGAMYRVLTEINSIQYQFNHAGLKSGQRITIVRIGEFGGISVRRVVFDSYECGSYAQYQDAVKMIFRPERKRSLYSTWFYRDALIYDGWLNDLPEDLLHDVEMRGNVRITRTKYTSFDYAQYDVVMNHYKDQSAKLLINSYKPSFEV